MGWKCAPQVMGLVRGEPKTGQKHRANGRKIAMEAGYERASLSHTLDKTRSDQNVYEGYIKGEEFWDAMEQEASEYRVQVKGKTKTGEEIIREKGLQHNAVIGWAVIYNPPAEVCADWTQEQYTKFHSDCQECMAIISPLFRKENIRMTAWHKDEGVQEDKDSPVVTFHENDGHFHDLGVALNKDGHYEGNKIDAKLLATINKRFPALMRERGWEMDDLDVTDFERAKEDKEYRDERDYKRGKSGKSVNQYIRRKMEKSLDEAEALRDEAEVMRDEVEMLRTDMEMAEGIANTLMEDSIRQNMEAQAKNQYYFDMDERARKKRDRYMAEARKAIKEERDQMLQEIEAEKKASLQEIMQMCQEAQQLLEKVQLFAKKLEERQRSKSERFIQNATERINAIAEKAGALNDENSSEYEGLG